MKLVLIFWWVYTSGADTATHSSIYAYPVTEAQCDEIGMRWLREPGAGEIVRPLAYTCPQGMTSYGISNAQR